MTGRSPSIGEVIRDDDADIAFSRATVSIVITNPNLPDNPIIYVNQAFEELTGYARTAAIGRNCRFLQGDETDPADVARIRRAVERREEIGVDLLNYRADRTPFLNRLLLAPIFGDEGRLEYFLGIQKEMTARDIEGGAERGDAFDQMRAVQDRVRDHLASVIEGILDQSSTDLGEEDFASLNRRIEALQLLYEEMIRPAPFGLNDGRVALGAYLSRVGSAVAHLEGRPGVRVGIETADVTADVDLATRLGLLASELLTNALRHAFRGRAFGSVEVRVTTLAQGGIRMSVADDGVGMALDQAFPAARSRGGRIIKRLVEGMDASISVGRGLAGTVVTVDVSAAALQGGAPRAGTIEAGE